VKKALVLAVLAALMSTPAPPRAQTPGLPGLAARPNIVFILTDDERLDGLQFMPTVRSQLVRKGLTFSNYFVVNPLCCPSRSTTLTGQYSHSTGVYFNGGKHGGFASFRRHELLTIAVSLHLGGYRTALVGKNLTGTGSRGTSRRDGIGGWPCSRAGITGCHCRWTDAW
jgi:N-acetylglucosamine-6-sulfatase